MADHLKTGENALPSPRNVKAELEAVFAGRRASTGANPNETANCGKLPTTPVDDPVLRTVKQERLEIDDGNLALILGEGGRRLDDEGDRSAPSSGTGGLRFAVAAKKGRNNDDVPESPESGEVSGDEASKNDVVRALVDRDFGNPEEYERAETPLQDEKFENAEETDAGYLRVAEANLNAMSIAARLADEPNTDGELTDDEKASREDENVVGGGLPPVVGTSTAASVREIKKEKPSVNDDYGELDYEEEDADDGIDKPRGGGGDERKIDEKSDEKVNASNADPSNREEGEDEVEEGEEVSEVKKESKAEKKKAQVKEEREEGEESDEGERSTDGELDDDDDCEEGEIREPGQKHAFIRPLCRFYTRGNCTWGNNCRFLHPGINDKGNYSMIDQPPFLPGPGMMGPMGPGSRGPMPLPPPHPPGPGGSWIHERLGKRILPRPPEMDGDAPPSVAPLPPPPMVAEPATESAWERGLRHAKEIRKMAKRKETDPNFDEKKEPDGVPVEREPVQPPPPVVIIPPGLPPPRDPYYDELPPMRFDHEENFYPPPPRPPMPLPPPEAWPFRPPPMEHFDMRWRPGPMPMDFVVPLPPPDFRLPERERGMRDRRFTPPPRFEPGRPDDRFNRLDRFGRHFRDGPPPREPLPPPPTDLPPFRGRGEEWKDPWLRSRSPKRTKRASSSHSGSRGRRRSRSHSKGSYSSFSSSSYSSKSRSRSRSSSYSSSYSKSSRSRSSFSSRSSSQSPGTSTKKRLPVSTTLGQSIMEKHGKSGGDGGGGAPRSVINRVPQSVIGSVPLPSSDKKLPGGPPPTTTKLLSPPPSTAAAAVVSRPQPPEAPPAVQQPDSMKLPPGSQQPPPAVGPPTMSFGIGAKPMVVPGRMAPLQPVGRGVAAAFSDKDDEREPVGGERGFGRAGMPPPPLYMLSDGKAPAAPGVGLSPQMMTTDRNKALPAGSSSSERSSEKAPERGGPPPNERTREREQMGAGGFGGQGPPRGPGTVQHSPSGERPPTRGGQQQGGTSRDLPRLQQQQQQPVPAGSRSGRSSSSRGQQMPGNDRAPAPSSRTGGGDRMPVRGGQPSMPDRGRSGGGGANAARGGSSQPMQPPGKSAPMRPGDGGPRGRAPTNAARGLPPGPAPSERLKLDPTAKARVRTGSNSSMSSHSSTDSASGSSTASHNSEHLYSDIASPISSASSLSPPPARSPNPKMRSSGVPDKSKIAPPLPSRAHPPPSTRPLPPPPQHHQHQQPHHHQQQPPSSSFHGQRSGNPRGPGGGESRNRALPPPSSSRPLPQPSSSHPQHGPPMSSSSSQGGRGPPPSQGGRGSSREAGGSGRSGGGGSSAAAGGGRPRDPHPGHLPPPGGDSRTTRMSSSSSSAGRGVPPPHQSMTASRGMSDQRVASSSQKFDRSVSGQLPPPMGPSSSSSSSRKRPASPIGRSSCPANKQMRRGGPEPKEPVKIPIPRLDKIVKGPPSPRRRSDSGQGQGQPMAMNKTPSKPPAKAGGGGGAHPNSGGGAHPNSGGATKRKTLSRREELLMQLQAVEDAIAKKRSKMQ